MTYSIPRPLEASIEARNWDVIGESLRALWPDIGKSASSSLAYFQNRAKTVDRLLVQIRPDGGALHFHLWAPLPRHYSAAIASTFIPFVESLCFERLSLSVNASDQAYTSLMVQMKTAIKSACATDLSPL